MHRAAARLALSLILTCAVSWPVPFPARDGAALAQAQKPSQKAKPKTTAKSKQTRPSGGTDGPPPAVAQKGPPPRVPFTAEDQAAAVVPGFPDARVWGDVLADFAKVLPPAPGPWLAMSGGGADGAFAAGLLHGWTQSGQRPDFMVVTGASIGALLAPYAFLGAKYDGALHDSIVSVTGADIFEDRQTAESFLDTWPLRQLIEKRVTRELVAAVAAEHAKGRRLLVITTNADAGRRVIWNMGAIAQRGDEAALKLFRNVLLASSAIPGFFTPVLIDVEANGKKFQELHIDGSVTAPFFVVPEAALEQATPPSLPASEIYIILNGRLTPDFYPPERSTKAILSRLIGVVLRSGLKAESLLFAANAQRFAMPIYMAQIAGTFDVPAYGLFDEKYMRALFEHGATRAREGKVFDRIGPPTLDLRSGNH